MLKLIRNSSLIQNEFKIFNTQLGSLFHTSSTLDASSKNPRNKSKPIRFLSQNKKIFEPQKPDENPRPAFVCHIKENVRYSPKKMWYIASFVRGMSVDEAIKQLSFVLKKGAAAVKEAIIEAQEIAVKKHNVEFKSNLWISESNVGKGAVFQGLRRHAKGRFGRVEYRHCHYFLKLEEGKPPEHFYLPHPKSPDQQLEDWVEAMRKRKVINSL